MKQLHSRQRAGGFSLIELMVSMVIGLVVVGAVLISYVGSGKAGRYQAAYSQMNQDAQIGLSILAREFQMAGYSQPSALVNVSAPGVTPSFALSYNIGTATAVFGCSTGFAAPTAATVACGTATTPAFEVVYEADIANTVPAMVAGVPYPSDCLGNRIPGVGAAPGPPVNPGVAPFIAHNRYFVEVGPSGRPELYCASAGANPKQPLLENVENMQVWYGVQAAATPRQVVRYATAAQVNAVTPPDWNNVISARVCLLMRSSEPVLNAGGDDTLSYLDCNSATQTSSDRYLRRAYFTTGTLRSKMAF
jgi:type IV pilus assembly protein PilW